MALKFSIVTCCWNSARYLPQSISSVLSQDYPDIEYIFIDGGSTDGTIELIRSVPKSVTFVTGVQGGISVAMNRGIEIATGDVIAHLHSDDYYLHGGVISRVAQALNSSGTEWCFGRAKDDVSGEVLSECWKIPRYSYQRLLKGNFVPHVSTFVRKRVFEKLGPFDAEYRYAMDYDMWLRIGKRYEPAQLDEHLGVFRRHQGSASTANYQNGMKEDFQIRIRHAGKMPWVYLYHYAHYLARKHRFRRSWNAGGVQVPQ